MTPKSREHIIVWQALLKEKINATEKCIRTLNSRRETFEIDSIALNELTFLEATRKLDQTLYDFHERKLLEDQNFTDLQERVFASQKTEGVCSLKACDEIATFTCTIVDKDGRHNVDLCPYHVARVFLVNPKAFKLSFTRINFPDKSTEDKLDKS